MSLHFRCHICLQLAPAPVEDGATRDDMLLSPEASLSDHPANFRTVECLCSNQDCAEFGLARNYSAKFFVEAP